MWKKDKHYIEKRFHYMEKRQTVLKDLDGAFASPKNRTFKQFIPILKKKKRYLNLSLQS